MELTDAVSLAVEECLRKDILTDFLLEHKAEVVAMSIYEYNEEYVKRIEREDGMELGAARKLIQIIDSALPNFENNLELTCKMLGVTVAEYENAKLLTSNSLN